MKTVRLLLFALFSCIIIMSCTSDNKYLSYEEIQQSKMDVAFVQSVLGTTDVSQIKNNTWGFNNVVTTRSVNKPDNMWGTSQYPYVKPDNIIEDEKAKVEEAFSKVYDNSANYQNIPVWDAFTIQHVSSIGNGRGHMDYIKVNGEHIYDFNAGYSDNIDLITNSKPTNFAYHNSLDDKEYSNWIALNIDGNWYVGFDYESNGQDIDKQIAPDHIYNDWIIKVAPGKMYFDAILIVEDVLGNSSLIQGTDFDYNDVVIGLQLKNKNNPNEDINGDKEYKLYILNVGASYDLYISRSNNYYDGVEIHDVTGIGKGTYGDATVKEPVYIGEYIMNLSAPYAGLQANPKLFSVHNNTHIQLVNNTESCHAPSVICIKENCNSFVWCKERTNIVSTYPNFAGYAKGTIWNDWWK
ncbi:MAG: hypothetical protein J6D03_00730 [Clostridia bacterium]|nr:hypothetical protein [Clostridia bacterium]